MSTPTLILASTSPRRRQLIQSLGLPVQFRASNADETAPEGMPPSEVVCMLAMRKAEDVSSAMAAEGFDGIVIGSDTLVCLDQAMLGKPADEVEAMRMLMQLQGRAHDVYTGVACIDLRSLRTKTAYRRTKVYMKPLSTSEIESYIASGEPMDKAGAYGIQGLGAVLIDRIEGCYFNVVGLPLSLLCDMLKAFHVHVLQK